jgi:hypothetical protein
MAEGKDPNMRRTIFLSGVCAFIMAFLGGILAFSLVAPPSATAQSTQAQVVRASAFELIAEDGTVIGRLMTGPGGGGNLELLRSEGTVGLRLSGGGWMDTYTPDGTPTFRAGHSFGGGRGGAFSGVQLGPDGSIGKLPD